MKKQFGYVYHSLTKTEPKNNCETFDCFYRTYVQISSEKLVIFIASIRHQVWNVNKTRTVGLKTMTFGKKNSFI